MWKTKNEILQLSFLLQKRAPALLDNIAQAFVMAPFFVLLEVNNFKCLLLIIYLLIYESDIIYSLRKGSDNHRLLQALQFLFGYEPYPGFHSRVQAKVEADIKEWREKNKKLMPIVQWLMPYIWFISLLIESGDACLLLVIICKEFIYFDHFEW